MPLPTDRKRIAQFLFISLVLLISITGFWGLYFGEDAHANGYHHLHVFSNFLWLGLIALQLIFINNKKHKIHKRLGMAVFAVGPFIIASLTLLSVYSANRAAENGRVDDLAVQNVMVTLEVGLIILLAFLFRKKTNIHASLALSSALLFMGIALFFTLLTFVPQFRIEGPETFGRFGEAAATAVGICTVVGIIMFFTNRRSGWPWLLVISFFYLNEFLNAWITRTDNLQPLTNAVGGIQFHFAFIVSFLSFLILLTITWRSGNSYRLNPRRQQ